MTRNGHNDLINRHDRLIAIRHIEGHNREIFICICKLLCSQTHICCTDFSTGSRVIAAEGEISFFIKRIADLHIVAADAVLCTVVGR